MSTLSEVSKQRRRDYMKTYRANHLEEVRENDARCAEKARARCLVDPEFHRNTKARRLKNKRAYLEKLSARRLADPALDRELKDQRQKMYQTDYARHKHAIVARNKAWVKANPERASLISHGKVNRRNARLNRAEGSHTKAEWEALKARHGHRCVCCGESKRLARDHIVALSRGGSDYISNIQPLCRECNSSKHNKHATNYMLSEPAHVEFV